MGYDPFWYGMIAWVDSPVQINDELEYNKFYVNNIKNLEYGQQQDLWEFRKSDNRLIPKFDPDELMHEMRTGEKPDIIDPIDEYKENQLFWLSEVYSEFDSVRDLNILASHRDAEKSRRCIDFICREWSRQFNFLLTKAKANDFSLIESYEIQYLFNFCEQIDCKLNFIINEVPNLIIDMEEIKNKMKKRSGEAATLGQILNRLKSRTPRIDNERFSVYLSKFKNVYRYYRTDVCVLTRNMLMLLADKCEMQRSEINGLIGFIPNENSKSLLDSPNLKEKEMSCDISSLYANHRNLKKEIVAFRYEGTRRPKNTYLEISDGRNERFYRNQ